ncbi:MAG: ferredoxin-type protein NapF [Rhodospirillales bacterium]|nr:ferredoxin-type protein NapF [Rhodospirillales bacterium]
MEVKRSDFLQGKFSSGSAVTRPPWAITESKFQDVCTGCDYCIVACPTSILKKARGGYPVVDFSKSQCTFCGECAKVCKPGAISRDNAAHPWDHIVTANSSCLFSSGVTCRLCGDCCDTAAITFQLAIGGKATPIIDSSRCTGCGACVAPCPVNAIQILMEEVRT